MEYRYFKMSNIMVYKNDYIINLRRLLFSEGDEEGVIQFGGYEVNVKEAVGLLRGKLVKLHQPLSGHHGAELFQ